MDTRYSIKAPFVMTASFFLTGGIFRFYPGLEWVFELTWIVALLIFFAWPVLRSLEIDGWSLYLIAAASYLIAGAASAARAEYGQPLDFGALAQRQYFTVFGIAAVYSLMLSSSTCVEKKRAYAGSVISACFWFNLAWNFVMQTAGRGLFAQSEALYVAGEDRLRMPIPFLLLGLFYYFEKIKVRSDMGLALIAVSSALGYILVFDGGRSNIVCVAVVLVFSSLWGRPGVSAKAIALLKILAALAVSLLLFLVVAGDVADKLGAKFGEAAYVILTGQESLDDSANSRLAQAEIIEEGIANSPWLGNGFLSAQFQEGFKTYYGYFHPSDNGLGGVVFVWGYIGLIIVALQFLPILSRVKSAVFLPAPAALCLMAFYHFIYSGVSGKMAFHFEYCVAITSLLIWCQKESHAKD
jgi:hypothetical protein